MTVSENRPNLPPSSRVLTLVGLILILTFFLDFLVRLTSPQLANAEIQLTLLNDLIDRGVIPLIGLSLIYAGFWFHLYTKPPLSADSHNGKELRAAWQDPKFWTFVFASLLGLMFLLIIPFHYAKTGEVIQKALDQVESEWTRNKATIDQQLNQVKLEEQEWQSILKDPTQLEQRLQNPQLPPQQKAALTQLKTNPQLLKQSADARIKQLQQQQTQAAGQLADAEKRKSEVVSRAEGERSLTRLRAGIRSILLAIAFASIGWTGLRDSSN
ncbi:HpsJ family protein [Acaryochloris sp. IP29b_bin.137]|uniref:HpsJ family protein n=1 Tax=Acaryochloris sp. IP29b_bin.137 TaxID=2969217 RepID=UPI0026076151|nr:HpsJ family protein [Acaryochloris sp. IP29b_bin.137]